jgi:Domain of unknown function DUF29
MMSHQPQRSKYDTDFYAWSLHNAALIRAGRLSEVDLTHVAEEIESMGKANKRELISRLAVLLAHLLKWKFQPGLRGNSWKYTIDTQRFEVQDVLNESPSLKHEIHEQVDHAYKKAVMLAAAETGFNRNTFPENCPFSLLDALNETFFPE